MSWKHNSLCLAIDAFLMLNFSGYICILLNSSSPYYKLLWCIKTRISLFNGI